MTEKAHATAIKAVLDPALDPDVAYDADDVPAERPPEYVAIFVSRRFGGDSRVSSQKGITGWRVLLRGVSQTSVNNVRRMLDAAEGALQYVPLVIDGETSTPPQFETARPVGPDDGWFSGSRTYTYTIRA